MNEEWLSAKVGERFPITYVAGGADGIVSTNSAKGALGNALDEMLIFASHDTIIRPERYEDSEYKLVQKFILSGSSAALPVIPADKVGDPLFDVYSVEDEDFYIERPVDVELIATPGSQHLWITGESGVGKTAAAQRGLLRGGWEIAHVFLSSHSKDDVAGLIVGICNGLADYVGRSDFLTPQSRSDEAYAHFLFSLNSVGSERHLAMLIEEIPVSAGASYTRFLEQLLMLMNAVEASRIRKFRFVFTSILDVTESLPAQRGKLLSRMHFSRFERWTVQATDELVDRAVTALGVTVSLERRQIVSQLSNGLPRVVKVTLRRWVAGGADELSLVRYVANVAGEMTL